MHQDRTSVDCMIDLRMQMNMFLVLKLLRFLAVTVGLCRTRSSLSMSFVCRSISAHNDPLNCASIKNLKEMQYLQSYHVLVELNVLAFTDGEETMDGYNGELASVNAFPEASQSLTMEEARYSTDKLTTTGHRCDSDIGSVVVT